MNEVIWFDLLSDEAVSYAAHVWKISKAEAWGKLDRAIQAEEISPRLPFNELQQYVQEIAGITPEPPPPITGDLPAIEDTPKAVGYKETFADKVFNVILTICALIFFAAFAYVFLFVSIYYGTH